MKAITTIKISSSQRRNRRDKSSLYLRHIYKVQLFFFRVMRELHAFYTIREFLSVACLSTIHQI